MLFPAWAGVILYHANARRSRAAFPRMGGGDPVSLWYPNLTRGFSPHGRG